MQTCRCCLAVGIEIIALSDEVECHEDDMANLKLSEVYDKVIRIKVRR